LFVLRGVDQSELLARAGAGLPLAKPKPKGPKALGDADLAAVFGLDMADAPDPAAPVGIADTLPPAAPKRSPRRGAAASAGRPGQVPGRVTGEARPKGGRKADAFTQRQPPAKPVRATSAAPKATSRATTPGKPVAVPARKAPVATTKIAPIIQTTFVAKGPAKAPGKPAAKAAAARAGDAGRKSQAKPEPKWAALARARKERTRRKGR
jgi:hypothetical protein